MCIRDSAYTNHIDKVSRELGEINDRVMAFLYDGDYESAGDEIEKLVQYLDENRTVLAATGNHEDFDKIEMNISDAVSYTHLGISATYAPADATHETATLTIDASGYTCLLYTSRCV